jgi:hypothetical protein
VSQSVAHRETSLLGSLFDDAAIFPPGNAPMRQAVRSHLEYLRSWYADFVGPFVCPHHRLLELEQALGEVGARSFGVIVTVPEGPLALPDALATARECRSVQLVAVEVTHSGVTPAQIVEFVRIQAAPAAVFVEIPVAQLTGALATDLAIYGLRAKLRTGGTTAVAFPSEPALAAALAALVAAGVTFKCTGGLHSAVRHRDDATGFEHQGFLNIALAVRELQRVAAPAAVEAVLADGDAARIARLTGELTSTDIEGVRSLFQSFGTCSIDEPLSDLLHLGLVEPP